MILEIRDLSLEYRRPGLPPVRALRHVNLDVQEGETVGLVGESGCGKSTLAYSIIRSLPIGARVTSGEVRFDGRDLLTLSERRMRSVRWRKIAVVFQSSMNAFSPVHRVVDQLAAVYMIHRDSDKRTALRASERALTQVGIPTELLRAYPHEFSGGMRQRAAIALALLLDPQVLIADEPTTALDVVVQDQVLGMIETWQRENHRTVIFVSHDVAVVSELCERVAVMYAGEIAEIGPKNEVVRTPSHPYTEALLECVPSIHGRGHRLRTLPGSPPDLSRPIVGCSFQPRCPSAFDECSRVEPALYSVANGHSARCLLRRTV